MEIELIPCNEYLEGGLNYFAKISIDAQVIKGQVYKEDLHKGIYDIVGKMRDAYQSSYILRMFNNIKVEGDAICFQYQQMDKSEGNVAVIQIENNHFRLEYAEFRNDVLSLLNLENALLPYICLLEALLHSLSNDSFKLNIQNSVSTTMNVAFNPNYSPFTVQYYGLIPYYAKDHTSLDSQFERDGLVYNAMRRFYQQFRSESPCPIPYLNLNIEAFTKDYSSFWK